MPTIDRAPIDTEKLTLAKVRSFISAWKRLLAEGCVSCEVRKRRKQTCMSCPANKVAQDGRLHYCSECGCGTRQPAILYVDGEPSEGLHEHPRLYMPDMKCPRKLISEHHGIGSWDAVGGRTKQFKLLMKATRSELKQFGKRSSHMIREIIYGTTKAKT